MKRRRAPYQMPAPDAVELLHRFPLEAMRQRRQWCGFKLVPNPPGKPRKEPVIADAPGCNASSTSAHTWRSFDEAVEGLVAKSYTAVGYALDGDIVGVDLDGRRWVTEAGELSEEAEAVVGRCGSYTEWSISGRGLHVLMHGKLPGTGRKDEVIGLELYSRARFLITTGWQIAGTAGMIGENQAAIDWILRTYFGVDSVGAERVEMTSDFSDISKHSEYSEHSDNPLIERIIAATQPEGMGQRNARIFDLARGLRLDAGLGQVKPAALKPVFRRWWTRALPVIGTKSFSESWSDFLRAWPSARHPLFASPVEDAFAKARAGDLPPDADGYDSDDIRILVGVCWHLSRLLPGGQFFLSSHDAAKRIGVSQPAVFNWLRMLAEDGIITEVEKGNSRRATRYRYASMKTSVDNTGGHGDNNRHAEEEHDD